MLLFILLGPWKILSGSCKYKFSISLAPSVSLEDALEEEAMEGEDPVQTLVRVHDEGEEELNPAILASRGRDVPLPPTIVDSPALFRWLIQDHAVSEILIEHPDFGGWKDLKALAAFKFDMFAWVHSGVRHFRAQGKGEMGHSSYLLLFASFCVFIFTATASSEERSPVLVAGESSWFLELPTLLLMAPLAFIFQPKSLSSLSTETWAMLTPCTRL